VKEGSPIGTTSTSSKKTFTYNLSVNQPDFDHSLDLVFTDIPGEWLAQSDKKKTCEQLFKQNDIVIVVISAPALMESDRNYNSEANRPEQFKDFLNELPSAKSIGTKHFFLVPLKSEKYAESPDLMSNVREVYKHHRGIISQKGHACYALPVNTLGSVIFNRFELDENGFPLEFYCLKNDNVVTWQPEKHDILAAHILNICFEKLEYSFPQIAPVTSKATEQLHPLLNATVLEIPENKVIHKFSPIGDGFNNGGGCFCADTLIRLADNTRIPISVVEKGMAILSVNSVGQIEPKQITKVFHKKNKFLITIVFADDSSVRVTPEHLFKLEEKWIAAEKLKVNDKIVSIVPDQLKQTVKLVKWVNKEQICCDAYNIYIENNCNYFANDVLVSCFSFFRASRSFIEKLKPASKRFLERSNHE
jgi:hypothetical protein